MDVRYQRIISGGREMTDPNVIISTFINKLNPTLHLFMRVCGGNEEAKET